MEREKMIEKMKSEIISMPCKRDCPHDGQITPCMKCAIAFLVDSGYRAADYKTPSAVGEQSDYQ